MDVEEEVRGKKFEGRRKNSNADTQDGLCN